MLCNVGNDECFLQAGNIAQFFTLEASNAIF